MLFGLFITIALIIGISLWSGRKAKDASTFTTGGGKASGFVVCGALMGTIVSGQSTVGTAQLAFSYGIDAWWFTIGAAIGCMLLALFYARPLRASGCTTLMEIVAKEFGHKAEVVGSLLCCLGIFISIVAQIISSSALLTSLLPLNYLWAALITVGLMLTYVVFGGMIGAGWSGIVKMGLLYVASIVTGVYVWSHAHGFGGLIHGIELLPGMEGQQVRQQYANLFARGAMKDMGGCLSLALGVLATQTYAQCILSGRSDKASRRGGLFCAFLIPPIGAACTLIGMYMRAHYLTAAEVDALGYLPEGMHMMQSSVQAFPLFITNHLNPFFGGVVLGTLFITIVGGGSGLALGVATILGRDVLTPLRNRLGREGRLTVHQLRLLIVAILMVGVVISLKSQRAFINDLGFLSLGLRATAVLVPLTGALFFPQRIRPQYAFASMIAGTAMLIAAKAAHLPSDSFYWGMGASIIVCVWGIRHSTDKKPNNIKAE